MLDIRTALRLDALASGGLGLVMLVLAGPLASPLGLATTLSSAVGVFLLAWAGFVTWVAGGPRAALVPDVIALNIGWVMASVVFAVGGWGGLTAWGAAFVLAQAGAVAVLTAWQSAAHRSRRASVTV